ncbi:hypothetical protein PR048_026284 [Dryococelus australis]|uniref:Uncharacterized protein n=1 Tax=Dryococelus australis TaxID=614101 RepID=A0ABQ9GKW4_9NEOP|nr:hypothetical protein PR048_026284 [Dryococelus australis]
MRMKRGEYGVTLEWAGETGDPRENPPTSGIVRHDSDMRKSGSDPTGNRIRFAQANDGKVAIAQSTFRRRPKQTDLLCCSLPSPSFSLPLVASATPLQSCTDFPSERTCLVLALISHGRVNGRSPRKPTYQRHHLARFPKSEVNRPGIEPGSPWWEASSLNRSATVPPPLSHENVS